MKIVSQHQIRALGITPSTCVDWVRESFLLKPNVQLPPKISLHPQGNDFFNTMPVLLPSPYNVFSVKVVHRIAGAVPSLGSDLLLYDSASGELLAMLDADWITTMRTGAVATLAAQLFRKKETVKYGMIGLGNTGRATMLCLLESEPNTQHLVYVLKYKDQAERFKERFIEYNNVNFVECNSISEIVSRADVIISCITDAKDLLCPDNNCFRKGCLVIPVHTKGFQNCDLFFDKVFGDDTGHLHGFRYFDCFRKYAELTDALTGKVAGRESDEERILSYNIGLGLHDALFATKVFGRLKDECREVTMERETDKFWI